MIPVWIVTIATAIYAVCTLWLIFEMRRDRKSAYRRVVKVILTRSNYPAWLKFELKNFGKGPTLNLKIDCKDEGGKQWKLEEKVLPLGSLEKEEITVIEDDKGKEASVNHFLNLQYTDIFDKVYEETVPFTMSEALDSF